MKDLFNRVYKSNIPITNETLQNALKQREEDFAKQHAQTVVNLITSFESTLKHYVTNLRNYRKIAKDQETLVKQGDLAFRYFAQTCNPLPFFKATSNFEGARQFCRALGIDYPKDNDELWLIPGDFKPSEAAPATIE